MNKKILNFILLCMLTVQIQTVFNKGQNILQKYLMVLYSGRIASYLRYFQVENTLKNSNFNDNLQIKYQCLKNTTLAIYL